MIEVPDLIKDKVFYHEHDGEQMDYICIGGVKFNVPEIGRLYILLNKIVNGEDSK